MPDRDLRQKAADDVLVVVRQDGDMLIDDKAQHEVGSLLHSRALGITLPAPKAVPLYGYAHPDAPPVQIGMAYVIRNDPPLPQHSRRAMNYIAPQLFEAYLTESTQEQARVKRRNQAILFTMLAASVIFFIFAMFIYPLFFLPSADAAPAAGNAPTSELRHDYDHHRRHAVHHRIRYAGSGAAV